MLSVLLVGVESRLFGEAALSNVFFALLILNGVAQHNTEVTTSRGEEGVPTNTCIRVCVLWGGEL